MAEPTSRDPTEPRHRFDTLDFTVRRHGADSCLELIGTAAMDTSDTLRTALQEALAGRPHQLIIDAARLRLLDAYCISVFVAAHRSSATRMQMIRPQGLVYRALRVCKLLDTFAITEP